MRKASSLIAGIAVLLLLATPLLLHFGQKAHNRLQIDLSDLDPEKVAAPGEAFARSAAAIIRHELSGTTGWRPNDLLPWSPRVFADNNSNRQLGILDVMRETLRVFKDHLTKVSSDAYDNNLVEAETLLRNDPRKWAFPSAESRYKAAVAKLEAYIAGLRAGAVTSRPINVRNMELMRLLQTWNDRLGDAHAGLFASPIPWLSVDDTFYHAQGYAHAIAQLIPALQLEYHRVLEEKPVLQQLFGETYAALSRAAVMKPIVVFNGGDTSVFANHRRNLDTYITEARQKLYSLREELEK